MDISAQSEKPGKKATLPSYISGKSLPIEATPPK
jgi:hypothetical protein